MTELAEKPPVADLTPGAQAETVRRRMLSPFWIRLFLLVKLPLGFMAGLRVRHLDRHRCQASVPYGWRTQNPFRSTYFAAQAMAAELSTGALAMYAVKSAPASIAMLITGLEGGFGKKATGLATFTCDGGDALFAAVAEAVRTGESTTATVETVGTMANGMEVARFQFTWWFKRRG
jgi:hypothetical protein